MRNAGVALIEVGPVVILTSPVPSKWDLPTVWKKEGQALL